MAQQEARGSSAEEALFNDLRDVLRQQELEPDNHLPPYQAGLIFARMGDFQSAVESYRAALERMPGFQQAHFNLGAAYNALERYPDAEACYKTAIRLEENDSEAWANLGAVQENQGRVDDALESYGKAVSLDAGEHECRMRIGRIHMAREAYEQARGVYDEATQFNANVPEAWNELGLALKHLEDQERAESCFRKALELDDGYAKAWSNLGALLIAGGDEEGGVRAYLIGVERDAEDPDIWFNLGEYYFHQEHRRTEECLLHVVDLNRSDHEAWRLLHLWYRKHPNDRRMLMVLRVLSLAQPDDPEMLRDLATANENLSQYPEAVEALENLLAISPGDEQAHLAITRLYLKEGRISEAYRHLGEVSQTTPEVMDHWTHLGHRLLHHGMEDEAEQCFLKALEHRPGIPELWHYCGEISLHREELELSKERFERSGMMNRNNRHIWMPLTRKFYGRGDFEPAAQCLDHLQDLESYLPDLWVEFFQVYDKAGQGKAFLARIQRLLETEQSPNRHWDSLADIYEEAGLKDQAAACREKLEPDTSIVLQAELEPAAAPRDADFGEVASTEAGGDSVEPRVEEEPETQYLEPSKPAPILLVDDDPADGEAPGSEPRYPEDSWIDQGEEHLKAGRVEEAVASLTRAMQEDIPRYRAWFRMGTLFYALGKLDEAEKAFHSAIERNPDVAKVWYNLGVCQAEQGKLGAARNNFRGVLGLDRRFAKAWDWLGLLQFNSGEYLPARRSFVRCLAVDRKSANGWHNLGMLYRTMGRDEESAHCLEQSRKLGGVEEKERFSPMGFSPEGPQ